MQWMEIESFSYFAYHKHTTQIPRISTGICWSALFIHADKPTVMSAPSFKRLGCIFGEGGFIAP